MISAPDFLESLRHPSDSLLQALDGFRPEFPGPDDTSCIRRLTDFFEASVIVRNRLCRIAAPLRPEISREAVTRACRLGEIVSNRISGFRMAEKALVWIDPLGNLRSEHLFVERVPEGRPLDEVLVEGCSAHRLHEELEALRQEFRRLGFSHGNLKPENLWLTPDGRLVAVRCYRARFDGPGEEDARAFEVLRQLVCRQDNSRLMEAIERHDTEPECLSPNRTGSCSEGMYFFCEKGRYGLTDRDGKTIAPPRYDYIEPFYEGRAVVGFRGRSGVIDKTGKFVIPGIYDQIIYLRERSLFCVCLHGQWSLADYSGRPLSDSCDDLNLILRIARGA